MQGAVRWTQECPTGLESPKFLWAQQCVLALALAALWEAELALTSSVGTLT